MKAGNKSVITKNILKMKKLTIITVTAALLMGLLSCHNEEWEFADYDYKGVYFPYQFPVRTLVLGDYVYDK